MAYIKTLSSQEVDDLLRAGPDKVVAHREWGKKVRENLPVDSIQVSQPRKGGLAFALGLDPELLYSWFAEEYHVLKEGSLDRALKELITVVVDDKNQCPGCVRFHSVSAKVEGLSEEMLGIGRDFDRRKGELPDKIRKSIEFAVKVSTNHTKITKSDYDELRQLGYTNNEILEIISVAFIAERFAKFVLVAGLP